MGATAKTDENQIGRRQVNFLTRYANQSRAYTAEYAVLLIITGVLLGIAVSFFGAIISAVNDGLQHASGNEYPLSLQLLASVVVLLPLLWLLTKRTRGSERMDPSIKNTGWRKAFLGIFLVVVFLSAIAAKVAFVQELFSAIANNGLVTSDTVLWKVLTINAFSVLILGSTALLYATDYRFVVSDRTRNRGMLRRLHRYGLVTAVLTLSIIYVFFPLQKQRNSYIDSVITSDLRTIRSNIENFYQTESKLPSGLNEMLNDAGMKERAAKYAYDYDGSLGDAYLLCANFITKNSEPSFDTGFNPTPLPAATGLLASVGSMFNSSILYPPNYYSDDFSSHDKGTYCFGLTVYGKESQISEGVGKSVSPDVYSTETVPVPATDL